jgi:hypothetical protein
LFWAPPVVSFANFLFFRNQAASSLPLLNCLLHCCYGYASRGPITIVDLGSHKYVWLLAGIAKPSLNSPHMLSCFICHYSLIEF